MKFPINKAFYIAYLADKGKLDITLEKLAEKVEDSAQQFQHIKDIASTPKDIAIAVKSQAFWVAETVKKNPASYLIAAASIFGAYWWLRSQKFH